MALLDFVERQADAAVLEVGLGGRLDSTNVCLPTVSVITSISFDHTKQLGHTLAAIAREKAGIIKPGVPVVSGVTEPEPQQVIAELAREHGCRLIQLGADFRFRYHPPQGARQGEGETRRHGEQAVSYSSHCLPVWVPGDRHGAVEFGYDVAGQEQRLEAIPLAMHGRHQAANAAVALAVIAELRHQGWCVSLEAMRRGLGQAALPGRVEILAGEPSVVLDTAHNPASARALVEALAELPRPSRGTLILSISRDKDVRAIAVELAPHFDRFIVTQYRKNPRAVDADVLSEIVRAALGSRVADVVVCRTPRDAWRHVEDSALPGEQVCIAGSFYLTAEMRQFVLDSAGTAPTGEQ
jgi:dihydrofolate synthase/folylpolyglutamate synthase